MNCIRRPVFKARRPSRRLRRHFPEMLSHFDATDNIAEVDDTAKQREPPDAGASGWPRAASATLKTVKDGLDHRHGDEILIWFAHLMKTLRRGTRSFNPRVCGHDTPDRAGQSLYRASPWPESCVFVLNVT